MSENLTAELIQRIVMRYRAQPDHRDAQQDLRLVALAMGVAEWGVADPAGLPPDPRGKNWASDTGIDSGKHLMSYAVGGGLEFPMPMSATSSALSDSSLVPTSYRWNTAKRCCDWRTKTSISQGMEGTKSSMTRFALPAVACPILGYRLERQNFDHFKGPAGLDYCAKYANKTLTDNDWRVFRTWMRAALRTRPMQEWLVSSWMEKYWTPSLKKVPPGPGYIEEVIVNGRIRNSTPRVANRAPTRRQATSVAERVQRELDTYGEWNMKTLKRRCRIMLRPVVLYRHFAGEPPLQGVRCPPGLRLASGFAHQYLPIFFVELACS